MRRVVQLAKAMANRAQPCAEMRGLALSVSSLRPANANCATRIIKRKITFGNSAIYITSGLLSFKQHSIIILYYNPSTGTCCLEEHMDRGSNLLWAIERCFRMTSPVFDVCKPVLSLATTTLTTLQCALKESLRQGIVLCLMTKEDHLTALSVESRGF